MEALERALNEVVGGLPALALERVISRKLKEQGIPETKSLSRGIAKHVLSGTTEPFSHRATANAREIMLSFNGIDAKEITHSLDAARKHITRQLPSLAAASAKKVLKNLQARR